MASSTASSSSSLHRCHQSGRSRCSTPTETSSRPRSSRGAQTLNIASLLLLAGQVATAAAKYQCFTNLGSYYPYCVNVPDSASSSDQLPVILMLSGSGARNSGDSSNVKSLSGYDGFGKVVNQYLSGNKGADQVMAAEKFITVVPISPMYASGGGEVRHWWPQYLDQVLDDVKSKFPVDEDAIHCAGYSMGARGCWRYAVNRPNILASTMSSAGAAEQAGDGTLSQQKADPTFPMLNKIVDMPVWQFDGSSDTTAGTKSPEATQNQLLKLGSKVAKLTTENTDHSGMSTMPFNSATMTWMLQQKRSGGSSSSSSSSVSSNSNSQQDSKADVASSSSGSDATTKTTTTDTSASLAPTRNAKGSNSGSSSSSSSSSSAKAASTGKCKKRRAKRSAGDAPHKTIIKRNLTLDAILASTGRKSSSAPASNASSSSPSVRERGLNLDAILSSRSQASDDAESAAKRSDIHRLTSGVERRASMGGRSQAIAAGGDKMARRLR